MKTTVEINDYIITIEEIDGNISVSATKDEEVVEEFTIEVEEGQEEEEGQEDVQGFDDFGRDEEEDNFGDDSEEEEEEEEEKEMGQLETFQSFISKKNK
jgi:hypothetical protein